MIRGTRLADGLVGRRAELTTLRSAVDKAARGTGAAVVVLGEAGIGKSRLLAVAVERAREAGMAVLTGRAVAGGGAYRALAAALAGHLRHRSPGGIDADEDLRPFLPALRKLLPGWTPEGDDPDRADEADPTVVLGEGVLRLLRPLAVERGCLVALEDLHWADADTVALVEYLADAAPSPGLLLVVSARDDGPRGAALRGLAGRVTALRPQRLSAAETATLAAAYAADLPAERLELVVAAADGLPLLVEELVRQGRPGVPPTFAALVEQRLADLDDDAAVVLRAAAVLGVDPPWTLLPQVADRPEPVVSAALRAAVAAGLLVTADGELRWRHALTCDAVAATALPPERAATAGRAADVLLARGPADDAAVAALLVVAGEDERAAALLGQAARRDIARGALRSAEALLDRMPAARAADVAADRVVLLNRLGRAADALDVGERALPTTTGAAHAELCLRLARAAVHAGQWTRALGFVDRAGRPEDPRTSLLAADAAFGAGDVARAGVLAAAAVAAAERHAAAERSAAGEAGDGPAVGAEPHACGRAPAAESLCEALELVARCAQQDGDLAAAAASLSRAASVAAEHGLLKQQVEAEFGRALLAQTEDGWRPELLARPRELALEAGMLADVARIDLIVADNVLAADGPAAAEPLAEACVALTGALRLSALQAVMQMILAVIRAAQGDVAGAQRLLESALAQPDRAPDVPAHVSMVRGFPPLLAGDLARADELMRPGMQTLLAYPAAPPLSYLGLWALLCAVRGDDEPARGLARRGAGRRRVNRAALAYAQAVDAGRSGASERAATHYAEADGIGADTPWWTRLLRMLALHAALADGWAVRVDAVGALRADLTEHERLGDHQLARTSRDLLRRAGAPTRRGRGATPVPPGLRAAGVTSREMDVLALVVDGLSNAEVAERLFLSPRTVETHVANLLAKTGSANRAQLRALTP